MSEQDFRPMSVKPYLYKVVDQEPGLNDLQSKVFDKMSKTMDSMNRIELGVVLADTIQAYKILGGDPFVHELQIALIKSKIEKTKE